MQKPVRVISWYIYKYYVLINTYLHENTLLTDRNPCVHKFCTGLFLWVSFPPLKLQFLQVVHVVKVASLGFLPPPLAQKEKKREGLSAAWSFHHEAIVQVQLKGQGRRRLQKFSSSSGCYLLLCLMFAGHQVGGHPYPWVRTVRCNTAQGRRWLFKTARVMLLVDKGLGANEFRIFSITGEQAPWTGHWQKVLLWLFVPTINLAMLLQTAFLAQFVLHDASVTKGWSPLSWGTLVGRRPSSKGPGQNLPLARLPVHPCQGRGCTQWPSTQEQMSSCIFILIT